MNTFTILVSGIVAVGSTFTRGLLVRAKEEGPATMVRGLACCFRYGPRSPVWQWLAFTLICGVLSPVLMVVGVVRRFLG